MVGNKAFDLGEQRDKYHEISKKYDKLYKDRMPALKNYEDFTNTQLHDYINQTSPAAADMFKNSKNMSDTYNDTYIPAMKKFMSDAEGYDTPERRAEARGKAMVDVGSASEAARSQALSRLESYGIDPSMARSASLDQNLRVNTALAQVQAAKQAESDVEDKGYKLREDAIAQGQNLPGQATSTAGVASNILQGGVNTSANVASTFTNLYGSPMDNLRAQQDVNTADTQAKEYEQSGKASAKGGGTWASIGSLAGTAIGAGLGAYVGGPQGAMYGAQAGGMVGGQAGGAAGSFG